MASFAVVQHPPNAGDSRNGNMADVKAAVDVNHYSCDIVGASDAGGFLTL